MLDDDALGFPGAARGVNEVCGVVGGDRNAGRFRLAAAGRSARWAGGWFAGGAGSDQGYVEPGEAGAGGVADEDGVDLGVLQVLGEAPVGMGDVHGYVRGSAAHRAEHGSDHREQAIGPTSERSIATG